MTSTSSRRAAIISARLKLFITIHNNNMLLFWFIWLIYDETVESISSMFLLLFGDADYPSCIAQTDLEYICQGRFAP